MNHLVCIYIHKDQYLTFTPTILLHSIIHLHTACTYLWILTCDKEEVEDHLQLIEVFMAACVKAGSALPSEILLWSYHTVIP